MEGIVRLDKHWRKPDVCQFFMRASCKTREKMAILIQNVGWYQIQGRIASLQWRKTIIFRRQKTVDDFCLYFDKENFLSVHATRFVKLVRNPFLLFRKTERDSESRFTVNWTTIQKLYNEHKIDINIHHLVSGLG